MESTVKFQFSLLQLVLFTLAAGVLLGFFVWAPVPTACVFFIVILPITLYALRLASGNKCTTLFMIALAVLMILGMTYNKQRRSGPSPVRQQLQMINVALELYRVDFRSYPPDTQTSENSAEILARSLIQRHQVGGKSYGPYMAVNRALIQDSNNNGKVEIVSPLGGHFEYKVLLNADGTQRGYILVDCGKDNLLGGTLDAQKGFVPDGSDANRDGVPDDADNLRSNQ